MSRSNVRFLAVVVLVLLGAPVSMHFVVHDLDHHHQNHHAESYGSIGGHGDHEHPVVSSPTPQLAPLVRTAVVAVVVHVFPAIRTGTVADRRNVIAYGALRLDNDVGLQPLLSTFLI